MNVEEFYIPMPWGHIAVKAWGHKSNKPVLVTHGRMDNAGSFDNLIPLLPTSFYYICIDLPSHGKSTFLPDFFPIHVLDFVLVYKLVLDYFKRKRYILLGHSMGAIVGNYVAQLYPEYVERIIGIDSVSVFVPTLYFKDLVTNIYDSVVSLSERTDKSKEKYTQEEIIQKVCNGRWGGPMTAEAAKPLVLRMIEPAENGLYNLVVDRRMLFPMYPLHDFEYVKGTLELSPITCPYLLIMCKKSSSITMSIEQHEKSPNFRLHWVDANHDVHITNPEMVAPLISHFLLNLEAKL